MARVAVPTGCPLRQGVRADRVSSPAGCPLRPGVRADRVSAPAGNASGAASGRPPRLRSP